MLAGRMARLCPPPPSLVLQQDSMVLTVKSGALFSWGKLFKTCLHTTKHDFEIIDSARAMLISGFLKDFALISQRGS